ncbi:MAG TPA: TspO/MBR family protein [Micromonosporaceae bacterium]|nr:TspO/MBR family protein [Micromonosporaceae bacterium]
MTTEIAGAARPPGSPLARWAGLAAFGLAVTAVAVLGSLAVTGTSNEYASLERPVWAPPSWLFGPVWTILYAMIAVSGWLVWRRVGVGAPLLPYAVQLLLNAAWTPIFFGAGAYGWALVDIAALWWAIAATVVAFRPVSRPAALLLVPYWLWVSYATALNASIWWLNR